MKIRLPLLVPLVILGFFALFPCVVKANHSDTDISANLDELVGIWSSEGYGHIVAIQAGSPKQFQRYEINEASCLLVDSGALEYFHQGVTHILRNADNTRFTYMLSGNITTYAYQRLDQLPEPCRNGGTGYSADPLVNFDAFWSTFNEQYAFFEQRAMDWIAARDTWRPQLHSGSSDEDLFAVLSEMVTPLCDAHVELASDFDSFNGEINPSCWGDLLAHIFEEFQSQDQYSDPFEFFQMVFIPSVLST
ncbi:MAG: hypothetical protein OQJ84_11375, partial [Xanthomonadales bacterium]|nr:hypothetical protein [Xanthomonadales bacterium]